MTVGDSMLCARPGGHGIKHPKYVQDLFKTGPVDNLTLHSLNVSGGFLLHMAHATFLWTELGNIKLRIAHLGNAYQLCNTSIAGNGSGYFATHERSH